jgi:uncharacterized membrane protein
MEKRILGVVLSALGIIGLILAAVRFASHGTGGPGLRLTIISLILGAIFFFSGISLVKNTNDKAT